MQSEPEGAIRRVTPNLVRLPSTGLEASSVFLVALLVRTLFAWVTDPGPIIADAAEYDRLANAIVEGRGYISTEGLPTSDRPPLYGYLLAAMYAVFGDNGRSVMRGLQALVDAGTCTAVYVLALRNLGAPAARVAAVFAVVSLSMLYATRLLLTETFAAFFMVATILALDIAITSWRWAIFFVAGAIVGVSTLTKATTLALPGALMVPIVIAARPQWRRAAGAVVLLCAGFVLTMMPWTVRNYRVHGEIVPVATQMGWAFYTSYVPVEGKIFGVYNTDETVLKAKALPEVERSRTLLRAAVDHVRDNPGELPGLILLKLAYFVSPFDWEFLGGDGVVNATYVLTFPLVLYGLWSARNEGWRTVLIAVPPAFLLLLALVVYGSPRIRFPAEPLMLVFAGGGLVAMWDRAGAARPWLVAGLSAATVAGFVAFGYSAEVKAFSADVLRGVGLW